MREPHQRQRREPAGLCLWATGRAEDTAHVFAALLRGSARLRIERYGTGAPIALHPIPCERAQVVLLANRRPAYDLTEIGPTLGGAGDRYRLLDTEVLHPRDRSDNAAECSRHSGLRAIVEDGAMRVGVDALGLLRRGGDRIAFLMVGLGERDAGLPGQHTKTRDVASLPLSVHWAGKQGYREVHRYAIAVHDAEPEAVARDLVNDLATGRIAYVPSFGLPA